MKKIEQFLNQHGIKILLLFSVLVYFKSCGVKSELNKVKKELITVQEKVNQLPTSSDLKIEGLKSEKRMIQATDRKMLDVERQNAIEKEIEALQKK